MEKLKRWVKEREGERDEMGRSLDSVSQGNVLTVSSTKLRDGWPFSFLSCIFSYLPLIHSSQVNLIKSQLLLVTVITESAKARVTRSESERERERENEECHSLSTHCGPIQCKLFAKALCPSIDRECHKVTAPLSFSLSLCN